MNTENALVHYPFWNCPLFAYNLNKCGIAYYTWFGYKRVFYNFAEHWWLQLFKIDYLINVSNLRAIHCSCTVEFLEII